MLQATFTALGVPHGLGSLCAGSQRERENREAHSAEGHQSSTKVAISRLAEHWDERAALSAVIVVGRLRFDGEGDSIVLRGCHESQLKSWRENSA